MYIPVMPSQTLTASSLSCPGEMRQRLCWADGKLVKEAIDEQLEAFLGPRGPDTPQEKQEKVQGMLSREEYQSSSLVPRLLPPSAQ